LQENILMVEATLMRRVEMTRPRYRKPFKNLKKLSEKIALYYNKTKQMKFVRTILGMSLLAILFASCQSVDFKKTSAGIPYKLFPSKKGDSVKLSSIVKYNVVQKIKDSVLYSSYQQKRPEYFQNQAVNLNQQQKLQYTDIKGNVEEILKKAKEGDSIYIVQSTDSLIKQNPQVTFKKGEQLITTVKLEKVYKNGEDANADIMKEQGAMYEENKAKGHEQFLKDTAAQSSIQKDDKVIEDYLKAHNIQAEKDKLGIYFEHLTPGQGSKPKFGQFANVKYKGMLLTGEVFDQGVYPVQIGMAQVVFGFMEAASQLSKGEKARIYIPSLLAYGPQGNPPKIKPNTILVFEMENLDITDKQPMPQQQPVDTSVNKSSKK